MHHVQQTMPHETPPPQAPEFCSTLFLVDYDCICNFKKYSNMFNLYGIEAIHLYFLLNAIYTSLSVARTKHIEVDVYCAIKLVAAGQYMLNMILQF